MSPDDKLQKHFLIILFVVFYFIIVLRNAWVCDDAYISFRVLDNFINGFGLRWNVAERVQSYSNPLWIMLLSPFYMVTRDIYFTSLIVSFLLSVFAVVFSAYKIASSTLAACLGIAIFALSDAFVDFSTSGLENPLTYALMILFIYYFLIKELNTRTLLILSLLASYSAVNRLDTALLTLPPLIYAFWKLRGIKAARVIIMGFLPLIAWELFSVIYYGFPLPNSAYAKLQLGMDSSWLINNGLCYFANSIEIDPMTILTIFTAIVIPFFFKSKKGIMISISLILYLLYIIKIGGCFMSGRFFAVPLLISVATLLYFIRPVSNRYLVLAAIPFLALGLASPRSPIYARTSDGLENYTLKNGINDERAYYSPTNGLMNYNRDAALWPSKSWALAGKAEREKGTAMLVHGAVGMVGYFGGPDIYIIDINALGDPLLARIHLIKNFRYKPGHYYRVLPPGYIHSLQSGENHIVHKELAEVYDKLVLITRGDLFSLKRLGEIIKVNFGSYNDLIADYSKPRIIEIPYRLYSEPRREGANWLDFNNVIFSEEGLRVDIETVVQATRFEFSRDHNDNYQILFFRGNEQVGSTRVPRKNLAGGGLAVSVVEVPQAAIAAGFDKIHFIPQEGDGLYSFGHIRFLSAENPG